MERGSQLAHDCTEELREVLRFGQFAGKKIKGRGSLLALPLGALLGARIETASTSSASIAILTS